MTRTLVSLWYVYRLEEICQSRQTYMSTEQLRQLLQFNLFTKGNKRCPTDGSQDVDTGVSCQDVDNGVSCHTCNSRNFDLKSLKNDKEKKTPSLNAYMRFIS